MLNRLRVELRHTTQSQADYEKEIRESQQRFDECSAALMRREDELARKEYISRQTDKLLNDQKAEINDLAGCAQAALEAQKASLIITNSHQLEIANLRAQLLERKTVFLGGVSQAESESRNTNLSGIREPINRDTTDRVTGNRGTAEHDTRGVTSEEVAQQMTGNRIVSTQQFTGTMNRSEESHVNRADRFAPSGSSSRSNSGVGRL